MLEQLTDIERRQELCRKIFFLDDRSFQIIEGIVREYQNGEIRKKTGKNNLPFYIDNERGEQ